MLNKKSENILYSFQRIGPEYITYRYPVEGSCLKEITEEGGIIGPNRYRSDKQFFNNIKVWNNFELETNSDPNLLKQLRCDLNILATKHKMYGAYTLLGSITSDSGDEYFKMAAEHGVKEGMVTHGVNLLRSGKIKLVGL